MKNLVLILIVLTSLSCLNRKIKKTGELNLTSKEIEKLEKRGYYKNDLTALYLNDCNLNVIPDSLYELTNLEELSLTNNQIIEISPRIGNLTKLKKLSLMGNNISKLPEEISNLTELETLYLLDTNLSHDELVRTHKLLPCTKLFIYLDMEINDEYNHPPYNKL